MNNYQSMTCVFLNNVIYGTLKKHIIQQKMFQMKQQYERVYILDFNRAKMIIKHDMDDKENSDLTHVLQFGDIKSCKVENDW